MYKIINRHVYEIASGENITLCDIIADSANDLPDAGDIALYKIAFGSFAYVIDEGVFYSLDSSGTWNGGAYSEVITEVVIARGSFSSLDARLDDMDVQIETNKNNISTDEAALVELVDGGAKNFINVGFTSKAATATSPSIINNNDGSITLNGSNTGNNPIILRDICSDLAASQDTRYTLPTGVYELCGTGNEDVVLQVYMHDGTSANLTQLAQASISNVVEFTYSSDLKTSYPYICFRLYIKAPTASHEVSFNNLLIEPMVCTKAAWDISHAYQPYRPSYQELYERVVALEQANQ